MIRVSRMAQVLTLAVSGVAFAADAQQARPSSPTGELSRDVGSADRLVVSGVSGRLNIRAAPTLDGAILERAEPGAMFGNEGCDRRGDREWCALAFLDGTGRSGYAAAEYLAPSSVRTRAENGEFDRIGRLDCRAAGQADWSRCEFGVARSDRGAAALVVYLGAVNETLLLFDDRDIWLAGADGDVPVGSRTGAGVVTIEANGTEISVPPGIVRAE